MILVSPAEPPEFLADLPIGTSTSAITESQYGSDFVIVGHGIVIAVQRKAFPGDFLASLSDARFPVLLPKMLAADVRVLILEGRPRWTNNGALMNHDYSQRGREFTRNQLRTMLVSLSMMWGIGTIWTDSPLDTAEFITALDTWAQKPRHDSLSTRPNAKGNFHRTPSERHLASHILQGFPGIGPGVAESIYDHFSRLPLAWDVSESELEEVEGLGPGRIAKLTKIVPVRET